MAGKIPNLWPTETVSVSTLSPLAILRTQAANLTELTHGLLIGEVITDDLLEEGVYHHFDMIAPALDGYRHRILTVKHDPSMLYPVSYSVAIRSSIVAPPARVKMGAAIATGVDLSGVLTPRNSKAIGPVANTESEFIEALREVFNSGYVLSVINSLIARSNETQPEDDAARVKVPQPA